MQNTKKPSLFRRLLRWYVYCLRILFIVLIIPAAYFAWKVLGVMSELTSFQPLHMLAAQYTPKDVVGDLGGMKVRIPRGCAEYVEYDGDPGWSGPRKGPIPERNYDSKLMSFGIDFRFPDMRCKDSQEMREDYRSKSLKKDRPWISIGINAGEIYPTPGAKAPTVHYRLVTQSIVKPGQFWISNYEKLSALVHGLEGYVVTGINPNTGKPARETEDDKYFHHVSPDFVDTYIRCGKTSVPGGVATCWMEFSMEPKAKVYVTVRFVPSRLPEWRALRQAAIDLLVSYEIHEGAPAPSQIMSPTH